MRTLAILVAERDKDVRKSLKGLLEERGHNVIAMDDGLKVIEHLENGRACDLVILGNKMEVMGGIETLTSIRINSHLPIQKLQVIVYSATPEIRKKVEALRGLFVPKEADNSELLAAVDILADSA